MRVCGFLRKGMLESLIFRKKQGFFMKIFIISLCLSLFVFISCSTDEVEDKNVSASISENESLNFTLALNNGKNLNIKAKDGVLEFENNQKATMFFFISTWCVPCLAEIPHLNSLQEKYKDNFDVVAVVMDDDKNLNLADFIQKSRINFAVSFTDENFLLSRSIGGLNGIPTIVLYKSDGTFFNKYLGIIPQEMLDIDIQKAIM